MHGLNYHINGLNYSASASLDGDHIEANNDLSFVVQPIGLVQVTKPFLESGEPISGLLAGQVLAPGRVPRLHTPNVSRLPLQAEVSSTCESRIHAYQTATTQKWKRKHAAGDRAGS